MASAQPLVDHNQIREWAESHGARPACVKGTGGKNDAGMLRLDFPGYSGEQSLQTISWNDWFRQFDRNHLALLVQDGGARGGRMSNFNKLVDRENATGDESGRGRRRASGGRSRARGSSAGRGRSMSSGTSGCWSRC